MSEAKIYKVKSRLGEMVLGRGGFRAEELIRHAEAEVEKIYPKALQTVDELLAQLDVRHAADESLAQARPPPAEYERIYACASRMIDAAICLPDSMLDAAARALCDLIDLSAELGLWEGEAFDVHVQAMRLLRSAGPEMDLTMRRKLVESLYQVTRKRVGDPKQVASAMAAEAINPQAA